MSITIRQSGGASIVSIPKALLNALGCDIGDELEPSIEHNALVLKPVKEELSLEQLLSDFSVGNHSRSEKDEDWENMKPVGRELL